MRNGNFILTEDNYGDGTVLLAYLGQEKIVTIPEGVNKIEKNVFGDESNPNEIVEKIILSSTVFEIEDYGLAYCSNLKEVQFNEELERIGNDIVNGCPLLEELKIPPRVKTVFHMEKHPNLKIIPNDNITEISHNSIIQQQETERKNYTDEVLLSNPVYKIMDGFMVNTKFMTTLYRTDWTKSEIRIPDGIKVIGGGTFYEGILGTTIMPPHAVAVKKVVIPSTVTRINAMAFGECDELEKVVYEGESKNLEIDEWAFDECRNYTENSVLIECSDLKVEESKKSKRITHLMLERFRVIHRAINSGRYPNTEKLRLICIEELGLDDKLSIATISRDLDYLRNSLYAPIEYDRYQNGYYYTSDFELKL